ncbi:MAG: tRNA uracil 4-sulfurtransferase ThiI, partial [Clostridia bacterium]
ENILISNMKRALNSFKYDFSRVPGRYIIRNYAEENESDMIECLKCVFGVYSVSVALEVDTTIDAIIEAVLEVSPSRGSFRVETNRADKKFPIKSCEFSAEMGGVILDKCPQLTVNLTNPQSIIYIDIREFGKTFVFSKVERAVNGMPVGTGGKGLVLLSGGIDSPVATYMMAKRGMTLHALHFQSYPFTSPAAKEKVLTLARLLKKYCINLTTHIVSFTEIQTAIHENCPADYMITIMRRFMMRIAEIIAKRISAGAIITGESLGQVASQTLESITSTSAVTTLPIFRPLIGFDKDEIVEISKRIGTFDTSILPYEDCCTVFLPKNPIIKPKLANVEKYESALDIEKLIEKALEEVEIIEI